MRRAGVRIEHRMVPTVKIEPRPGEEIGSVAYLQNSEEIERKYAF
jgi:hypothetical protein